MRKSEQGAKGVKRLRGVQEPTFELVPYYGYTEGEDCGELAERYGLKPDPWQQAVLDGWLACDEEGIYISDTCGISVPRQNGKNGILEMVELFKTVIQGRKILHTAHEVKTCRKAFIRLKRVFEDDRRYPELVDAVDSIRRTNGQEAIILKNGGSIEFIARSKSSGLGFTVDDIVFDEAQELTDEQYETLRPTLSAAPSGNPQVALTGTPTRPSSSGTVFKRTRNSAHEPNKSDEEDGIICWFEWSVDEIGDVNDRSRWERVNPAIGYRILEKTIKGELASMSEDGFARERLGWWPPDNMLSAVIRKQDWEKCATKEPPKEGTLAYGVKFAPDGSSVSLAVALKPKDGKIHVELIETRSMMDGVFWFTEWITARWRDSCAIVIDGMTGASALIEALIANNVSQKRLMSPAAKGVIAAAVMFDNAVKEGTLTHFGHEGQELLDISVLGAAKRAIGNNGGWGFTGIGDVDVTPVEAASLAFWGVSTSKIDPTRKLRIG